MLRKVSSTINMNKMSVLGLPFGDIDGQVVKWKVPKWKFRADSESDISEFVYLLNWQF